MTNVLPPTRIRFEDEAQTVLVVEWRDDHVSRLPLAYLRGWCPCATCQGHGSEHHFVEGDDPRLAGLSQVGAYALGLSFADGHATGIYPWPFLRQLCPCEACGGPPPGTPDGVATAGGAS